MPCKRASLNYVYMKETFHILRLYGADYLIISLMTERR